MKIFGYTITRQNVAALEQEMDALRSICKSNYDHEYEVNEELERVRDEKNQYKNLHESSKRNFDVLKKEYDELLEEFKRVHGQPEEFEVLDMVNSPRHYQSDGGIECIEAMSIESAMLERIKFNPLQCFCYLNVFKYIWRREDKGNTEQDDKKALWYINRLNSISTTNNTRTVTYGYIANRVAKYKNK